MDLVNILLVDDNQLLSDMVKRVLVRNKYSVTTCSDLLEAQCILEEKTPAIIIISMDAFGDQVHSFIKNNKTHNRNCKFVMISSFDNEVEILKIGADDWLRKPYNLTVLLTRLEVLCRKG